MLHYLYFVSINQLAEEQCMAVGVFVNLTVAEGRSAEFEAVYSELAGLINEKEPGCNYYQVHKSRKDPQVYVFMGEYTDQAAHAQTDYSQELFAKVSEFEVFNRI